MQQRSLGLWTLVALVVANMIGAGVFTTSGFAMGDLGSPWYVLAAWLIGGVIALCGALSYGALTRLLPVSGGEYLFLSRAVHPLAGFVAGWISLLAGFTGAIAYSALTFAAYALPADAGAPAGPLLATAVIAAAAIVHAVGVGLGAWVQNGVVLVKLLFIGGFCLYAVFGAPPGAWQGMVQASGQAALPPFQLPAFAMTLMWVAFSYSGFNAAIYLADEVPRAREVVPRAMVIGTLLTGVLYCILNAIFVLAPLPEVIAGQQNIAALAAQALGGEPLAMFVRGIIALALLTSVLAMLMAGPRVYAKMADDGLFPRLFRFTGATPVPAILGQAVLAMLVVWISQLRELLSYLGFTLSLSTAATIASLFLLVRRDPRAAADLPGYPWAPLLFVGATVLFAALAASHSPVEMLAALLTIASGAALYAVLARRGSLTGR